MGCVGTHLAITQTSGGEDMSLTKYIIKRIVYSIGVLFGVSILIFVISNIVPGDPARMALGPRAPEWAVEDLRKEMNLDKPLVERYFLWLSDLMQGDLGESLRSRRPITKDIAEYLPASIEIIALSAFFMAVIGINLGRLSARFSGTWFDGVVRILSYTGIVTPAFVWAILFVLLFSYLIPIFPTTGRITPGLTAPPRITGMYIIDGLLTGNFRVALDAFWHIVLPSLALSMGGAAQAARMTRASMVDNAEKDYILAARAYGVPSKLIYRRLLLKPSLVAPISIMALDIAALLGNAFLVELVFLYPGISRYGIEAMLNKDLFAIISVVLIIGIGYTIANVVIDVIIAHLDPRVRLGGAKSA